MISFHPSGERWLRSTCRTRAPSGSTRDQLRAGDEQDVRVRGPSSSPTRARPGPSPTTSLLPSKSTATRICLVPQFENHSRPSCQRGDSGIAKPSSNTRICMRLLRRDYRLDHRRKLAGGGELLDRPALFLGPLLALQPLEQVGFLARDTDPACLKGSTALVHHQESASKTGGLPRCERNPAGGRRSRLAYSMTEVNIEADCSSARRTDGGRRNNPPQGE